MGMWLGETCLHCGQEYRVYFQRRFPDGQLQVRVGHGPWLGEWRELKGFDQLRKVEERHG